MESAHTESENSEKLNYINCEGLWSWWMTVDHKRLGLMYLGSILLFFIVGGLAALAVRLELAHPEPGFLGNGKNYNRMFTLHGISMIFLFIVPGIPATLGNFLLPLMIGAKDVVFPRLNRLSFWIYVIVDLWLGRINHGS